MLGFPSTLLLRIEAIGFPTFGLLLYYAFCRHTLCLHEDVVAVLAVRPPLRFIGASPFSEEGCRPTGIFLLCWFWV